MEKEINENGLVERLKDDVKDMHDKVTDCAKEGLVVIVREEAEDGRTLLAINASKKTAFNCMMELVEKVCQDPAMYIMLLDNLEKMGRDIMKESFMDMIGNTKKGEGRNMKISDEYIPVPDKTFIEQIRDNVQPLTEFVTPENGNTLFCLGYSASEEPNTAFIFTGKGRGLYETTRRALNYGDEDATHAIEAIAHAYIDFIKNRS